MTSQLQPDGSLLLTTRGDVSAMRNLYDEGMTILTALSLTNAEGEGCTEVFYQAIPSAEKARRTVSYSSQGSLSGLKLYSGAMYYDASGAWLSVKLTGGVPAGDVTLTCVDQPAFSGIVTTPIHRVEETIRYNLSGPEFITSEYDHLIFRLDGLDSLTDVFYPALTFSDGRTLQLVSQRVGDVNGPTRTPAASATPAPTATPQPEGTPSIPEDAEVLQRDTLTIASKPTKYSHYHAALLVTEYGYILQPTFRYHDPLPEGTVMRLIAIDGVSGEYGEGVIGSAGLENTAILGARIPARIPDGSTRYTLAAYAPDTEDPIFEITLTSDTPASGYWSGDTWYAPDGEAYYPMTTPSREPYDILDSLQPIGTPMPGQYGQFGDTSIYGW